ncbi:MAG: DEAD/DEAH box helicase [Myxococcota bacterium]
MGDPLSLFQPAVRSWFEHRFPAGPTEPQARCWPAVANGEHTLLAAPTGSGKTLAAFLVCIDALVRRSVREGSLADETRVLYVSPLKALASDIQHNLERPLAEMRRLAASQGRGLPEIRALVRSGDSSAADRAAMLRRPPHLLVTTPESLYLLLTAERSRERLRGVDTVIADEIHAVARDKRGSHLALSLERLTALCDAPPQRIGLSATQRPVETLARLLVGAGPGRSDASGAPACRIIDLGHRRALELDLEIPSGELEAVATTEQFGEILDRIAQHVAGQHTTLVFVNTRRLAERVAHQLEERLGEGQVAAHHGSLSKERRARLEARLRAGDLRALVATASLELGIDIGPVELVCQIGSPRSLATFLQRVGRSGHSLGATPRGVLLPTSRDELVECAALLRGVRAGRLDRVHPPQAPLDILAQQIVAACAAESWDEEALFTLVRGAAPFASLDREDFDSVVEMVSDGVRTGRGRVGAWLHRDRVNGRLRARRGTRITALTSGGAIPENADYRVVADPDDTFVGTVNEDFAIESMVGDVFLLGSTSWRIRRVSGGVVRVRDAAGVPPTIPFWLGEAPARTEELSVEVSRLRSGIAEHLEKQGLPAARRWLEAEGFRHDVAESLARYLDAARGALGVVPTREDIVFERFFDETGGMQLVVHAPFGGRINRGLGLALRKRFCRSFDFELQAAANDDAVVLSLGPQHGFELPDVARFLSPETIDEVLAQAILATPMFTVRWRWNLGRALLVPRQRGGRRIPPPIQRMQADDLMAALFPRLAACQENTTGPIEIPEHPIVRQTLHDCLSEATDVAGLRELLAELRRGGIRAHFRETTEPSPLAHEILNGKPYTFLDDAPLEERRTRAVALRRGLPESARDLGRLDAEAVARVREEVAPAPRDADELHDLLLSQFVTRPDPAWAALHRELVEQRRATTILAPAGLRWLAAERQPEARALFPTATLAPALPVPRGLERVVEPDAAAAEALRGHLEALGPVTPGELAERTGIDEPLVVMGCARLEAEGFALRGCFDPRRGEGSVELCARRLLSRIHLYTQERLRREIEPVTAQDFLRFLLRWQYATPDRTREGRRGLLAVVEQLQGFELGAGAWEESVLPARVSGYRREWLDELCLGGQVAWGRLGLPGPPSRGDRGLAPSRATPITFVRRDDLPWLLAAARGGARPAEPEPGPAARVLAELRRGGALFPGEIAGRSEDSDSEVEAALFDLVSRGLVVADGFGALRALLGRRAPRPSAARGPAVRRRLRRAAAGVPGRFALLPDADGELEEGLLAEAVAEQLLVRWGVVFRDLMVRESLVLPWRELLRALRRMEARGTARGGRFVTGFAGEQYALPGAVEALRHTRRRPRDGERVVLTAADPLNLIGILTPGPRVPALRGHLVAYRDGAPCEPGPARASAS